MKREHRLPDWLRKRVSYHQDMNETEKILSKLELNTVCKSAKCPNLRQCFANKTATFMILGNTCTRNCSFCAVENGEPELLDSNEPGNIAKAVNLLGLRHVVITSVTRDDLADGGASQFVRTVGSIRNLNKNITIEILTPDFNFKKRSLEDIARVSPDIFNHNIETVPTLYDEVRPQALYKRSLNVLAYIKNLNPDIYTKSGIMVGLGETEKEVVAVMEDLLAVNCDILTIGQYLQPSKKHLEVKKYVRPEQFDKYKEIGLKLGFMYIASGPFVRSSFHASDFSDKYI